MGELLLTLTRRCCDACWQATGAFVVGLTATPLRLDPSERLSAVFQRMIKGPSINELVADGVLVQPTVFGINQVSVHTTSRRAYTGREHSSLRRPLYNLCNASHGKAEAVH